MEIAHIFDFRVVNAGFEDGEFLIRSEDEDEVIEVAQRHTEQTHDTSASRDHLETVMQDV